jgi:hypothetical protein
MAAKKSARRRRFRTCGREGGMISDGTGLSVSISI